jgi:hypothetical protein
LSRPVSAPGGGDAGEVLHFVAEEDGLRRRLRGEPREAAGGLGGAVHGGNPAVRVERDAAHVVRLLAVEAALEAGALARRDLVAHGEEAQGLGLQGVGLHEVHDDGVVRGDGARDDSEVHAVTTARYME